MRASVKESKGYPPRNILSKSLPPSESGACPRMRRMYTWIQKCWHFKSMFYSYRGAYSFAPKCILLVSLVSKLYISLVVDFGFLIGYILCRRGHCK